LLQDVSLLQDGFRVCTGACHRAARSRGVTVLAWKCAIAHAGIAPAPMVE
jgi:hypothetical protein